MSLPTSLPTIPASWTAPSSCFASTNYYYVLWGNHFSNMYGTPTPVFTGNYPTGDCFPPSSTKNVPYLTDGGCPSGYTRACATGGTLSNGQPASSVTCCPSVTGDVFSFMCWSNEYGCHATATAGVIWTGVKTDIGLSIPTEEPVTRTPSTKEGVEAWGIKFIYVAPTPSQATTSQQITLSASSTPGPGPSRAQSQLSTGAIVGISLGSLTCIGLLALVVFLLCRRKRSRKRKPDAIIPEGKTFPPVQGVHQLDAQDKPHLLDPQDPRPGANPVWEMAG